MNTIPNLEGEVWRDADGFPQYQVSNRGRIKSFKRTSPRILKTFINNKGYQRVALMSDDKKSKRMLVSRVVANAFCDKPADDCDTVDHIDGDKLNNNADNLRWMTSADNTRAYFYNRKLQEEVKNNEFTQ